MHHNRMIRPQKVPLYLQTVLALALGVLVGWIFGERAAPLGNVSKWIIEAIKTIAMPLLFFAITEAIYSAQIRGQGVFSMLLVCTVNGVCAIAIALTIVNFFHPGSYLPLHGVFSEAGITEKSLFKGIADAFSTNPKASILSGTTLAIFLSLLLGVGLLAFPRQHKVEAFLKKGLEFLFRCIGVAIYLIPVAVFCAVAKVIGVHGKSFFHGLLIYLILCLAGMMVHVGLVYQFWIRNIAKIPLKRFWKEAKEPVIHSFGINSSLATLPVTLNALRNLGVSEGASRLGACIGTNLNNDGILLYEVFATLFLAQAYGVDLALYQQLLLAILCVVATIGVAGVPEAGIISLSLLASALGLPLESIPILLTVDWILARVRSMVNVTGDMTVSIAIDRLSHHSP